MSKKTPSYQEKLNAIKDYTTLGINSRKYSAKNPQFTLREKKIITKYYNIAKSRGYLEYNPKTKEFTDKVKFVKSKKKKQEGAPKFSGYFVQGASPEDKIKNGKIIKSNYTKEYIPLDFSGIEDLKNDGAALEEFVIDELSVKLDPYWDKLKKGNYFTIVLQNGWELGQKKTKKYKKSAGSYKEGQAFSKDLSGDEKFLNLADHIISQLYRGSNKYEMNIALVAGIYLWEFKNQRKPTNKEKSVINKKRKKK